MRTRTILLAAAMLAGPTAGQPDPPQGEVLVRLETALGNIDLAIDVKRAPITAGNFLKYVDGGFYDGGRFHRATRADNYKPNLPNRPLLEIIQGDISPARAAERFPAIPLERTSVTGLTHVVGTVSMPRGDEADSARAGFVIHLNDQPSLNYGGMRFDDGQGTAAFGRVVAGMDVVRTIQRQPVEGQSLAPPVEIRKAYRMRSGAEWAMGPTERSEPGGVQGAPPIQSRSPGDAGPADQSAEGIQTESTRGGTNSNTSRLIRGLEGANRADPPGEILVVVVDAAVVGEVDVVRHVGRLLR